MQTETYAAAKKLAVLIHDIQIGNLDPSSPEVAKEQMGLTTDLLSAILDEDDLAALFETKG